MIGLLVAHTLEGVELLDLGLLLGSVAVADGNIPVSYTHLPSLPSGKDSE